MQIGSSYAHMEGVRNNIMGTGYNYNYDYNYNVQVNLYCNGKEACRETTIISMNNAYCYTREACENSTFIQINNNIYVYGYLGLYGGIVNNMGDSLYCNSVHGCSYSKISNINRVFANLPEFSCCMPCNFSVDSLLSTQAP